MAPWLHKSVRTIAYLTDNEIGTSADSALTTQIIAQRGNSEDASVVKEALGIGQVLVTATGDIWSDITVVIGADASTQFSP